MALITDPDLLNQNLEVSINPTLKTVTLAVTGALSTDGVTLKALYSFLKEEWKNDATLIKYDFPMTPITDEQMQIGVSSRNNGWNWGDTTTRQLIRTGGWQEVSSGGVTLAEYAGVVTLGSIEAGAQVYYQQESGGAATNIVLTDEVNQAIQVYNSTGPVDYRSYLKLFVREQGDSYAVSDLTAIGVTTMTYQVYRFPLASSADLKITTADVGIDADSNNVADVSPYSGMDITYYAAPQARVIGGLSKNFGIIIDGNSGTAEQIYEFVQWSLRRTTDINAGAGTLTGKIADELLEFVGDTLKTKTSTNPEGGGTGVYIDNFLTADINRLVFKDNTAADITYPYTANLTLNFSSTLQTDASAVYRTYFTNDDAGDNAGYDFGTSNAIIPRSSSYYASASRERNTNVATIHTSTAHGFASGQVIEIETLGGSGYNGTHVITTVPTATSFSFANAGSNEGNTADTAGVIWKCIGGRIAGNSSLSFGYDFDSNDQRGAASMGLNAPITVVAIGLSGAQYVLATGTIEESTANSVSLVAPIERNYLNA